MSRFVKVKFFDGRDIYLNLDRVQYFKESTYETFRSDITCVHVQFDNTYALLDGSEWSRLIDLLASPSEVNET